MQQQRLAYVDLMRSTAIIFMIFCHSVIYWSWPNNSQAFLFLLGDHIIGDFAAPLFLFLVGFCLNLSPSSSLKRGLFIFITGFIFAIATRGPEALFDWDVLPMIGSALIFLQLIRRQSEPVIITLAIAFVAASPILREFTHYLDAWGGSSSPALGLPTWASSLVLNPVSEFQAIWDLKHIFLGFLIQGYFPIFPWMALPLLGFWAGKHPEKTGRWFILALATMLASFMATPWSFYPENTGMFLLQFSICLLSLVGTQLFCQLSFSTGLSHVAGIISRYSLSIYIIHHLLLLWPKAILGQFQVMPLYALFVGIFLILLSYFLARVWDSYDGKYSFEWLMKKVLNGQFRIRQFQN